MRRAEPRRRVSSLSIRFDNCRIDLAHTSFRLVVSIGKLSPFPLPLPFLRRIVSDAVYNLPFVEVGGLQEKMDGRNDGRA